MFYYGHDGRFHMKDREHIKDDLRFVSAITLGCVVFTLVMCWASGII